MSRRRRNARNEAAPNARLGRTKAEPLSTRHLIREATGAAQAARRTAAAPVLETSSRRTLADELADLRHRTRTLGNEVGAMSKQIQQAQNQSTVAESCFSVDFNVYGDGQRLAEEIQERCHELGEQIASYFLTRETRRSEVIEKGIAYLNKLESNLVELSTRHASSAASLERVELGLARLELEASP